MAMVAASVEPHSSTQATQEPASLELSRPLTPQAASVNGTLSARAGVAISDKASPMAALPSPSQAPNVGAPPLPTAAAGSAVNWNLPAKGARTGAAQPREGVAGADGTKWDLPSKILSAAELQPQDGCISRFDDPRIIGMCSPMVVCLGPLFPWMERKQEMEETKWRYVHNLIRRGHCRNDMEKMVNDYLCRIKAQEPSIRQRYRPSECRVNEHQLVEMMVLDGLFVIEVLLNNWMGKIDGSAASPRSNNDPLWTKPHPSMSRPLQPLASTMVPQALREEFTPLSVKWEPHALRFDLIVLSNQMPFFVLQELFEMTDIPELGHAQKQAATLKKLVIDYLIGDAGEVLAGYDGPVYHILHLVYLHLTFSEQVPNVQAQPPSLLKRTRRKFKAMGADLRAFCKRTFSCSSSLPVSWQEWKVIPPARELARVGLSLKCTETHRFADVRFKNGVVEIPAFAWRRYHIRLLTNLVVLEIAGWWPPEKRLFCNYVMFMAELITTKDDAVLLFEKGIVRNCNADEVDMSLIAPFRVLADFNHGSKYQPYFAGLVRDMIKCYERWHKLGTPGCRRS